MKATDKTKNKLLLKVNGLEADLALKEGLPHLFGMKHYQWSYDFVNSTNRMNFLCAANQISKSSTNIRKCITWATSPSLWKKLWPSRPTQFWYMYPSMKVCTDEYHEKWVKEWLPKGEYKDHPQFGWTADIQQKKIVSIRFNTGVTVYFRSYEQKSSNTQTSSVYAIFADEEMPVDVYNEVIMRLSSPTITGYFHMVFTATLGQEFWREVIEEKGSRQRFPTAFKQQIAMYDCLKYMDGSNSPWTPEKIALVKAKCRSQAEIDRRVYGRFVVDEGLLYESYDRNVNYVDPFVIPDDWLHFSGVDIGSGGATGHPGAIAFCAVSPDFRNGVIYDGWRGDNVDTTAGDIFQKYRLMRAGRSFIGEYYDWNSKDFFTISTRLGESFQRAEKGHDIGEGIINVAFKNRMLSIFRTEELAKLDQELTSLQAGCAKTSAKDDFADAMRYAVSKIPWDFSCLLEKIFKQAEGYDVHSVSRMSHRERLQKGLTLVEFNESVDAYQQEFNDANSAMEYDW